MGVKFSISYNTASDWVKGVGSAVVVATPLVAVALNDGDISGSEWTGIVSATVLAFLAALGFYQTTPLPTPPFGNPPMNVVPPRPPVSPPYVAPVVPPQVPGSQYPPEYRSEFKKKGKESD